MSEVGASTRRVLAALAARGLEVEITEFADSTRTAQEAAAAVGCDVAQIVKSLIFRATVTDRLVLVLTSGVNRVDEKKLKAILGEPVKRADADFVRERTGFAIGGVPPIGHTSEPVVLMDEDLLAHDVVWAAAGTPHTVFSVNPARLAEVAGADVRAVKAS